ncbi:MAG: hypothetical protein LBH90_07375 [Tannerella sp.]|jgi:hypothetical protein|nr:hypothetical protein [Tannerella sp.]
MTYSRKPAFFFILLMSYAAFAGADESWRDQMKDLIYSPRYFGPNAFPIPELRGGRIGARLEAELRGEYHHYRGDETKDVYARLFIPLANGLAGVELYGVIKEDYKMTEETKKERHAVETEPPVECHGDFIISSFYQVLRSEKWFDMMVSANIKTASGNRVCDARYTDAAAYWFDASFGRNVFQNADKTAAIRMQMMAGFYCWMTNDLIHRQNDAFLYGIGTSGNYKALSLSVDYSGFYGYKKNGDSPMALRTKLNVEYKKNILSVRFKCGFKDNLYTSYSVGYIRCF